MVALGVRSASFAELPAETAYRIWQLRTAVFVVEQACAYQELDGRDLEPGTRHLWVQDGDEVVAYLRVLTETDTMARIGRVCVAVSARSMGLARRLVLAAQVEIGARISVLDAQSHLAYWYRALGYEVAGPQFIEDGIPHLPMRRTP
jgi:ElaA protein